MNPWFILGVFVLFSFISEAMTGFGSIVIALSLGALFLPISQILPVLIPLSAGMNTVALARNWRHVDWRLLLVLLLPAMALGTFVGWKLRPHLDPALARVLFGVLIVGFASRELWRSIRAHHSDRAKSDSLTRALTVSAGITHGLFASGGPLLVYALAGKQIDKARLRATLIVIWCSMNISMTIASAADGTLKPALPYIAALAPIVAIAWLIGDRLHDRVNEVEFRRILYSTLIVVGALLLISPLNTLRHA